MMTQGRKEIELLNGRVVICVNETGVKVTIEDQGLDIVAGCYASHRNLNTNVEDES